MADSENCSLVHPLGNAASVDEEYIHSQHLKKEFSPVERPILRCMTAPRLSFPTFQHLSPKSEKHQFELTLIA